MEITTDLPGKGGGGSGRTTDREGDEEIFTDFDESVFSGNTLNEKELSRRKEMTLKSDGKRGRLKTAGRKREHIENVEANSWGFWGALAIAVWSTVWQTKRVMEEEKSEGVKWRPRGRQSRASHRCYVCGKRSRFRCGRCRNVRYCSECCQRADWGEHRKYCMGTDEGRLGIGTVTPSTPQTLLKG